MGNTSFEIILENFIFYLFISIMFEKFMFEAISSIVADGDIEVDFAAESNSGPRYCQVVKNCNSAVTLERETRSLLSIRDNYPKFIISLDKIYGDNYNGIKLISLFGFSAGSKRRVTPDTANPLPMLKNNIF